MSTDPDLETYIFGVVALALDLEPDKVSRGRELHLKHIEDIVTRFTSYIIRSEVRRIDIRTVGDLIDSLEKL